VQSIEVLWSNALGGLPSPKGEKKKINNHQIF